MSHAVEQQLPAATWSVDPVHSSVGFALKYMTSTFRAGFERFDATLDSTGDEPKLVGSVDPSSIAVRSEDLHAHLQSAEFFDTANHPELRFESRSFRADGDALVVDGELTLKGITHPVEARGHMTAVGENMYGNARVGVHLEAVVDRREFDLNWNAPLPSGGVALADETKLIVDLFFVKA